MIEESLYDYTDYIHAIIRTNGAIANDGGYWTGYRVFIRTNLDEYPSVSDWNDGYREITEFVFRTFASFDYGDIMYGGLASMKMDDDPQDEVTNLFISRNDYKSLREGDNWLVEIVRLAEMRFDIAPSYDMVYDIDDIIAQKLDTTSPIARIEERRYQLTSEEKRIYSIRLYY